MSHDMAGDDQCISMDTDVTITTSTKDKIMAMEDDGMEERWGRRETLVGQLVGAYKKMLGRTETRTRDRIRSV